MLCEETRHSLSLYVDDCVSLPARLAIETHLDRCPVCRAELAELRSLTRRLSLLPPPAPPTDLAASISNALVIEAAARRHEPNPSLVYRLARFVEPRLMPYSVGSFASVLLFFLMFTALRPHFVALREAALNHVIVLQTTGSGYDLNKPISAEGFAASRAPFTADSPTLDPDGALVALTNSYDHSDVHVDGDEDGVTVVADVFSNGVASLADVMQPPRDRRMLYQFESALRQNAAFVSASLDGRPNTMRVVFTVQTVDVNDRH